MNLRLGINAIAVAAGGENTAKLLNLTVPAKLILNLLQKSDAFHLHLITHNKR